MQLYRVLVGATLLLIVFAFLPPELVAQENEQLIGSWRGGLEVGGGTTLTLVFNITQDDAGTLTGTMDSPDQGAVGIPLEPRELQYPIHPRDLYGQPLGRGRPNHWDLESRSSLTTALTRKG